MSTMSASENVLYLENSTTWYRRSDFGSWWRRFTVRASSAFREPTAAGFLQMFSSSVLLTATNGRFTK